MAWFADEWLARQRRRWTRPDAEKWIRRDAHRWMHPKRGSFDLPRADDRKSSADAFADPAAWSAERDRLLRLKAEVATLRCAIARHRFRCVVTAGFDPDQPRDDWGRWANDGAPTDVSAAKKVPPVVLDFGKWAVRKFISSYCEATINRELPGEFENLTIEDVWDIARGGNARARKCMKLLTQPRFRK